MTTLDDLARRNAPTFQPRTVGPSPAAEPVDELTVLIRQQQADSVNQLRMDQLRRQQRAAEMAAEAEALKAENDLEDERLRQEERRAERRALRNGGGGGAPDGGILTAMMDMMVQSQRDTQGRLDALNAAQQEALRGELGALKELIKSVLDKPQPNAIETVRQQIEFFQALQGLVPKPTAESRAMNMREMLEVERARAEMEMERAKFQRDLQRDDAEKAKWEAEAEAAQRRATMLGGMISQAFPQLTEAITARIAGRPEQVAISAGATAPPPGLPPANGHVPGIPQALPWTCPKCTTTNYAAIGTETAACSSCELMVELAPAGPPAEAPLPPEPHDPED